MNTKHIRTIFVLFLLTVTTICFGQKYRVRAINDYFYVPDSVKKGHPLIIASTYFDTMMFRMSDGKGNYPIVITKVLQGHDTRHVLSGRYDWELLWVDSLIHRRTGQIVIWQ